MGYRACDDDETAPPVLGRTDAGRDDAVGDDLPGFYIPDPESRTGLRIWWVKRKQPGPPPRRQVGFRP